VRGLIHEVLIVDLMVLQSRSYKLRFLRDGREEGDDSNWKNRSVCKREVMDKDQCDNDDEYECQGRA